MRVQQQWRKCSLVLLPLLTFAFVLGLMVHQHKGDVMTAIPDLRGYFTPEFGTDEVSIGEFLLPNSTGRLDTIQDLDAVQGSGARFGAVFPRDLADREE